MIMIITMVTAMMTLTLIVETVSITIVKKLIVILIVLFFNTTDDYVINWEDNDDKDNYDNGGNDDDGEVMSKTNEGDSVNRDVDVVDNDNVVADANDDAVNTFDIWWLL